MSDSIWPDWPYNSEAASRLLDPELIVRQGDFFLRRALNIRRLVVFAGSGLSMAYGRVSWVELAETQITGILSAKKSLTPEQQSEIAPPLEQLLDRLDTLRDAINDNATDVIVLSLQLSEQVWLLAGTKLLKALQSEFQLDGQDDDNSEEARRKLFRQCVKAETYDERHHAKRILSDPFGLAATTDRVGTFARENLRHRRLERFPTHGHPDLERLFSVGTVGEIGKQAELWKQEVSHQVQPLCSFAAEIAHLLGKHCKPTGSLDPINYPGVGLALDAMRAGFRLDRSGIPDLAGLEKRLKDACDAPQSESVRERFVARERDPLWILAMNLEIKRFITTNYDLDIERLIDDLGFRPTAYESQTHLVGDQVERIGPMGGRARDIVLGKTNAAEMIDFASGESPHHLQVMHVHGRATDHEDIVVTERDYQNMYLGEGANKIVAREGMQVLFGGNPVLFAGIGLSEGDLMRPLREFAMEHLRRNHSVIALAPAAKEKGERSQFVMEQYIRHGVYVLHYGFRDGGKGKDCWLEAVFKYTKTIKDIIDALSSRAKFEEKYRNDAPLIVGKAIEKATSQMLGALGLDSIKNIDALDRFRTDDSECSISLEIGVLTRIGEFLRQDALALRTAFDPADKERILVLDTLFKTVLTRAVKRIEDAIRTIALSAYLRGLEGHWREWAETWSRMPKTRSDEFNFSTLEDLQGLPGTSEFTRQLPAQLGKTRWFRHLIDEAWSDGHPRFERLLRAWRLVRSETEGRRLWLIAAPRGAGKGSLLGELTRYGDFLLNRSQADVALHSDVPEFRYAAQFLMNFSFSSEISSAWDAFSAFLLNPLQPIAHQTLGASDQVPIGRIGRIRAAIVNLNGRLEEIAKKLQEELGNSEKVSPRCLVVFQAFDLLFEADGYPKTAEIRAICDLLFDGTSEGAPIDLVLILKDSRIPLYFRREGSKALSIDRNKKCPGRSVRLIANVDLPDREAIASMVMNSDLQIDAEAKDAVARAVGPLLLAPHLEGASHGAYIHFLESHQELASAPILDTVREAGWGKSLFALLSRNRLQLRLFLRVIHDIGERDPTVRRAQAARDFALAVIGTENSQGQLASDRFFEKILDYWQRQLTPLPSDEAITRELVVSGGFGHLLKSVVTCAYDFKLQELLLRHLSVISTPVEADVLAVCPQIASRLRHIAPRDNSIPNKDSARLIVGCALFILANRGLVFTIHKRKLRSASERYQVHRAMQLHIYRKLGAQSAEPADSYTFALSLFASQTRELPLLVANAYAFLHELVNDLVGLPKPSGIIPSWDSDDLQVRCLKAGIGVARTLFSIGVVARFDDLGGVSVPISPRPGYFEHHRLILRWMLLCASAIGGEGRKTEQPAGGETPNAPQMPFYPDEIIWLFNECGVFSLAQGQMFDAIAMFDAALKAAESVEGRGNSPLRRRILLNLALCSIYRGRPNDARRILNEVRGEKGEDEAIQLIATGHLGLLDHIGGSHESALRNLNLAIRGLTRLRRFRSVSMFLRHRGDLYRDLQNFPNAERDLAEAIDFARLSGSQDMVWFAIVARTRLDVTKEVNLKSSAKTLEDAERYADAMELPLLIAETCFVHAQMLLRQGETALAGEKATRALRLATLHGLTLRSIAYRNLLADIHAERGWADEAKRIRGQALQAARNAGYRLILQRNPQETG